MAPEVVKQSAHTPKADIWSVGCLVVEMLTGEHPWASLTQMQAIFKVGHIVVVSFSLLIISRLVHRPSPLFLLTYQLKHTISSLVHLMLTMRLGPLHLSCSNILSLLESPECLGLDTGYPFYDNSLLVFTVTRLCCPPSI